MVKSALAPDSIPDPIEIPGAPSQDAGVRQGLLKRLILALRIAKRTIQYLGADGFSGAALPEGNFAAEKPLAEAAMLLYVASRERSDSAVQARFEGLVQDLIPYARSKQMGWDTLRYPSVCLQMTTPHILLERMGSKDPAFNDLLARSVAACASRGHEVVPYRELEIIWLRSLWRNEIPGCELEETARKTALGNPIDLLNGTREDAYAHTHAIMYYTDFGNWQRPLPRSAEEYLCESAAVLARALIVEDYDLAAEALMAWPLTSSVWSPAAAFGFRVLASLEDKVGFLPGGPSASKRLPELAGEERTRFALASSYHTAFVMGMLCALALKPGMASPFEIAGRAFSMTLIEGLQSFITKTGAHWEEVFESLSPNEQAALGPFLLDVAMIQGSRKSEFGQMVKMLETAMQNGMADTTLCAQSAELLSRVGAFAVSTA
jgi:hypothetical protein